MVTSSSSVAVLSGSSVLLSRIWMVMPSPSTSARTPLTAESTSRRRPRRGAAAELPPLPPGA
ncbi:hypothetical protein A7K94_0215260, partial [Modestobacter sp. VKM Ac-2676]